jgi:hypothetical protein
MQMKRQVFQHGDKQQHSLPARTDLHNQKHRDREQDSLQAAESYLNNATNEVLCSAGANIAPIIKKLR